MVKNITITGGHFENKGAQAMLLAVVQEIKSRNKNIEIYAFTDKPIIKDGLNFKHIMWDNRMKIRLFLGKMKMLIRPSKNRKYEKDIQNVISKSDLVLDISGYTLTSQFGFLTSLLYLLKIALFKRYNCKVVLLPQSFGPFKYKYFYQKLIIFSLMKYYLRYPEKIFVREQQGYDDLQKFTVNNLVRSIDIVLQTQKPNRELIMQDKCNFEMDFFKNNKCIAIVPNTRITQWNKLNNASSIYCIIIDYLVNKDFQVYIVRHSYEDMDVCNEIYKKYCNTSGVTLLGEDYDCIALSEIISQMDFAVVSRYHALVHAYKSGVPAIVIGWAAKYREIMKVFDQTQYHYDVRNKISSKALLNSLEKLINESACESKKISSCRARQINGNVLMNFFDKYIGELTTKAGVT